MSWIDLAAAISSNRHSRHICVTASIDQLDFLHPIRVGDTVIVRACVYYAGRTSMIVGVTIDSEDYRTGKRTNAATCNLTFVALDQDGKPVVVPEVRPETEEEKTRHEEARQQRERLKQDARSR